LDEKRILFLNSWIVWLLFGKKKKITECIIEIEDNLSYVRQATSGFCPMHFTIEGMEEIKRLCMARKYPHEPIGSSLGHASFYSGSIRNFSHSEDESMKE